MGQDGSARATSGLTTRCRLPTCPTWLQHGPDAPGHKFLVSELLAAGAFARSDAQYQVEDFPADSPHGSFSIGDAAGVHVHVVLHAPVHAGVRRDLDHRD